MVVKELVALLGVKADKQSFDNANGQLSNLAGLAKTAVTAFAGLKIVQFVRGAYTEVAVLGDHFDDLSKRTGIATSELQGFEHAAELSGASLDDIASGIRRLQSAQVEAKEGVATYSDEFRRMGVKVTDSSGKLKSTTDLLVDVAEGMKGLKTDAERSAVAMKLLGRGGVALIPMLKDGGGALHDMMSEMETLGGVIEDDMIKASADYLDNQRRLQVSMRGIKIAIAKEMLPAINALTSSFIDWWKANGAIIRQRIGNFFDKVARVVSSNVTFFGNLLRKIMGFVQNLTPLQKRFLRVISTVKILGKVLKAGPIGKLLLLASIVALIIDDFQTWKEGGKSAIGTLMDKLGELLGLDLSFDQWSSDMQFTIDAMWLIVGNFVDGAMTSFGTLSDFLADVWDDPDKAFQDFYNRQIETWDGLLKDISRGFQRLGLDIDLSIESWKKSVVAFVVAAKSMIPDWFKNLFGGKTLEKTSFKTPTQAVPQAFPTSVSGKPVFGGNSFAPQTKVEMTINAAPGMNEKTFAQEIDRRIGQTIEKQNRAALRALTPARG